MSKHNAAEWWHELDTEGEEPQIAHRPAPVHPRIHKTMPKAEQAVALLAQADGGMGNFDFTYQATRHERQWISESLGGFYEQRWIDDVLRLVKGGKEATVYLCEASANLDVPLVAGKVYRPRKFRNLKKDYLYREGREELDEGGHRIYDDRVLKAIRKRTGYGKEVMHKSWLEHEYATLQKLYAAGVDVPRPYASGNNAILMDYVGDEDMPAPPLAFIHLERSEAQHLYERVVHNIELMLAQNRIHADLSAYNILYWEGEIRLIDFPQAIEPEANPSAFRIFERDVLRICEYFARHGVRVQPRRLAVDLWTAYNHRLSEEVHPAYLNAESESDVAYWKSRHSG